MTPITTTTATPIPTSSTAAQTKTSTTPTSSTTSTASSSNSMLSEQNFFTLLSAELKYQDPTSPVSGTAFMGELAQFSALSTDSQMQTDLSQLVTLSQNNAAPLLNGAALIGKTVTTAQGSGAVTSTSLTSGVVSLAVKGLGTIPLTQVTSIA